MPLRYLLVLVFCGLLVVTAGVVGGVGYSNGHVSLKEQTKRQFAIANESAADQIGDFLNAPAERLLGELTLRARRGMLHLDNDQTLGLDLAERLRANKSLAWISYSEAATGKFVGVWRDKQGRIVLNRSVPGPQDARETVIYPDGRMEELPNIGAKDYDPRMYTWYLDAAAKPDAVAWSKPYDFEENVRGITASRAWRPADSGPATGVFTVDFYLDDLEDLLTELGDHTRAFFCVLNPEGEVLFSAHNPDQNALKALAVWVKRHPDFKNIDPEQTNHLIQIDGEAGTVYLTALFRVHEPTGLSFIVAGMVRQSVIYERVEQTKMKMIAFSVLALAVAAALGWIVAYRISEPLRVLGGELARVGQFQLAPQPGSRSLLREVNQLRDAAERMKAGLRSFMKYVPGDLVRQFLATGTEAALGGEIRRMTLFFSDIEGFTTYSEKTTPTELVRNLSRYLEVVSRTLSSHGATIDKFIGDGLMAFFNAPQDLPGHERQACVGALVALRALEAAKQEGKLPSFRTRIGINAGDVLVGNMGTPDRFAYSVLGDPVNVASRLEGLNKVYGTQIIASDEVREHAGGGFEWRHLDRVAVAGRKGPMEIYELIGEKAGEILPRRDTYEKALACYFRREFVEARELFSQLVGDKAAEMMAARCEELASARLPVDWAGVYVFREK